MITPHILILSLILSLMWGTHLVDCIKDYRDPERRGNPLVSLRYLIVAFCLWTMMFAYVLRTGMILAGLGTDVAGQIVFFALIGTNIPGAIFVVVSRRYD